jgi:hypothetical protein
MTAHRSAAMVNYYEYDKDSELTCSKCGWRGPGRDTEQEIRSALIAVSCPSCDAPLLTVMLPTAEQVKAAAAAGNAEAKKDLPWLRRKEAFQAHARETALQRVDQLPELAGDSLAFEWDIETVDNDHWTVIRAGDVIVWRELAYWEGWPRFNEVRDILKARYQERFESLTPTLASELYLFGDDISASKKISTT